VVVNLLVAAVDLTLGKVNADHLTGRAHHLGEQEDVASRATTDVQDLHALDVLGDDEA